MSSPIPLRARGTAVDLPSPLPPANPTLQPPANLPPVDRPLNHSSGRDRRRLFSTIGSFTCGQSLSGSTAGKSNQVGSSAGDQIYTFSSGPGTCSWTFNSCGSGYDTWLRVYQGSSSRASCDDCGPCGTRTVLTASLAAGSYYFVVDGFSSSTGKRRRGTGLVHWGCPS